jgi:AcrR family transcriptional regulator
VIGRPHTGGRRNEAAEQAILRAAAELLAAGDGVLITMAAIAERAGVGKQTIYRWWPSKSAVLLDAMIHRAEEGVLREALTQILDRACSRGQISSLDGHHSVVDQAFGLVWYRMIFAHQPLDEGAADEAAAALATQLASPLGAQR